MSITMTIEVSPEQAVLIAEMLKSSATAAPVQTAAQPVASTPVAPPAAAAPAIPVQSPAPMQNPAPVPVAPAPAPVPVQQPAAPAMATPPTAVKKYTADELSIASRPIVEAGRQQEVLDLLHSFTFTDTSGVTRNVQNIREMPEELYPAFANGIRQLGGRI